MIKVERSANNLYGFDQLAGASGNGLEDRQAQPPKLPGRASPFSDRPGWRPPGQAPRPAPAATKPEAAAQKLIDARSANIDDAFRIAQKVSFDYAKVLNLARQHDYPNGSEAAQRTDSIRLGEWDDKQRASANTLSDSILEKAEVMIQSGQAKTAQEAIGHIRRTYAGAIVTDNKLVYKGYTPQSARMLFDQAVKVALEMAAPGRSPKIDAALEKVSTLGKGSTQALGIAIADKAALMCRLGQADTPDDAINKIVDAYQGTVGAPDKALFVVAVAKARGQVQTTPAPKK
jgi:hypothetical protein